jgi:hypothetical protein
MMRLSDAIRLGAMTGPQTMGALRRETRTCALGAAYVAAGILNKGDRASMATALAAFPILGAAAACPHCAWTLRGGSVTVAYLILHLNDHHRWTREAIADWVQTLEPDETTAPQSATGDVRGTAVLG